ncbi:GntR family transcriptional regulator [Ureaplasma sp. ES3154-GEN]|uniref:GntR family transcriptional regulator n=1 Tax=Ureaplasma sp. ES3154-GEN TaxID=2984844 RepID=UPI0021E9644F|nr:GntR family transcriptional regulator [Ureaplasma sp. ES3154-GEN]MCV3743760.1 GntR family transcriptional regulator [Ureaplasma sp. ES3154-GEN]
MTSKSYILRYILFKIANNDYPLNTSIPSEHNLAHYLSASRITIHNALEKLKSNNILKSIKGSGYYVDMTLDAYLHSPLAYIYKDIDHIKINIIDDASIQIDNHCFNYCYQIIFYQRSNILAIHYLWSKKTLDLLIKPENINISKALIHSGINDFFNIQTVIADQIINPFLSLKEKLNDGLKNYLVLVNKYFNSNDEVELLSLTKIKKNKFLYNAHKSTTS